MDKDLINIIKEHEKFYKNIESLQNCDYYDRLFIPDITKSLHGFYQTKLNDKLKDVENEEEKEKITEEYKKITNEDTNIEDDYIKNVVGRYKKIKRKQHKLKEEKTKEKTNMFA
jgi:hypothetical protein